MSRAYYNFVDYKNYNPDGTMKDHWRKYLLENDVSESNVNYLEEQQKLKVIQVRETHNISDEEWNPSIKKESYADVQRRQRKAIRNGEEISSLPLDIEPDEYYELVGS